MSIDTRGSSDNVAPMASHPPTQKPPAFGPTLGHIGLFVVAEPSTRQSNTSASARRRSTFEREMRLRQDVFSARVDTRALQMELEAAQEEQRKLEMQLDEMRMARLGTGTGSVRQDAQALDTNHGQRQAQVEIAQFKKRITELQQEHAIPEVEKIVAESSGPGQLGREARATLETVRSASEQNGENVARENQLADLKQQIEEMNKENFDAQRERRDTAMKGTKAAERNVLELKEELAALRRGEEGQYAEHTRLLRARDRQISDLTTVRDNLRAEVIRRNGRVVGSRGEVNRERYNPARWNEAGRRERESRPRLYRDEWGPEGIDNLLREEWPAEYQPGSPVGERGDDGAPSAEAVFADKIERVVKLLNSEREEARNAAEQGDMIDVALASLQFEVTAAYQGVRALFPEIRKGEGECLTGLIRIFQQKRRYIAEQINGLRTANGALQELVQDLEVSLQEERIRGGRQCSCVDEVCSKFEGPRPSKISPLPDSSATAIDDVEDEECGKSDSGGRIPESLCYDNSESRYSPPGSPPNASPRSTPLPNEDDDREDPDSEGITGQGATQEPAGQESVEREIELHGLQVISNLQQDGGSHNRQRVIASGHVCKELAGRRSPDRDQPDLNRLGPLRPASNSTGEPQNADPNPVVGPSTMKSPSASAVRPGRRRRYPPPAHQGPDEGEVGAPAGASPGPPSHAGSRATRNPAPAYCAPPQRKRKAAGRGDGEAPRKRR